LSLIVTYHNTTIVELCDVISARQNSWCFGVCSNCLLCIRYPIASVKALCFQAAILSIHIFVHQFVCSLPRYLMNGVSNLNETYRDYSLGYNLLMTCLDSGGQKSRSL